MKKIKFTAHILPHLIAVVVFFIITIFFFNPIFFENKTLQQYDIQQFIGSSKDIVDYRNETGKEALWTNSMFSGMPAYMISVQWGNGAIAYIKKIISLTLPSPVANIYMAFISYYIMLLVFGIRPYLAIAGAVAFGLSSYMIIGLGAGHNGRIGAIACMPLVMAGIHMTFTGKKILGFGLTTAGLALHLRENHLQITYYLLLIVLVYGLIRLIEAVREKRLVDFFKNVVLLIPAVLIAAGSFFGQFWAITEYTKYSIRGPSDLTQPGDNKSVANGVSREWAFAYNYGIWEPMTLLIPEFYGGSSANSFVEDKNSESFKALVRLGDNKLANQFAQYSSAYWGPQSFTAGPYYAGAIVVFLFVIGILFADKSYVWWLVPLSALSLMLSWGDSFSTFNYFMFDYFPGYNKFRSVNFALVIILFAMPLLGLLGLERLWQLGLNKETRKKLLIALGATGGLCLLLMMFAGMLDFTKDSEGQFPGWFMDALIDDRKSLLRSDAFRSLAFIVAAFVMIYFDVHKKITPMGFYAMLIFMITVDLAVVNKRYLKSESFNRARDNRFSMTPADQEILKDKSYYRVYNPRGFTTEARTSYFHHSIGGYHGAKIRRYQDFYDSCLFVQTQKFFAQAQQGNMDMSSFGAINMLNIKYFALGPEQNSVIPNAQSNGNAWFVSDVISVNSPAEELRQTCDVNTKTTAVIDASKFTIKNTTLGDVPGNIVLLEMKPNYLKYESNSTSDGLAVFSEIYYPEGWIATIDGNASNILRANYILRALEIPAGKHTIEFSFKPKTYTVGNKVTTASSWLVLIILLGSIYWTIKSGV